MTPTAYTTGRIFKKGRCPRMQAERRVVSRTEASGSDRRAALREGMYPAASAAATTTSTPHTKGWVSPMDPITYAAVSAVLAAMTLVATYLPARRASRVDPVVALRGEA
jgi:hypothetical protein